PESPPTTRRPTPPPPRRRSRRRGGGGRSEEHTSELQSRENLVCRLLLEKKKTKSTLAATAYPSIDPQRDCQACGLPEPGRVATPHLLAVVRVPCASDD